MNKIILAILFALAFASCATPKTTQVQDSEDKEIQYNRDKFRNR